MEFQEKLQLWVQENKKFLILLLAGGVGFFGILGGVTVWKEGRDQKKAQAVLSLIDRATQARDEEKWDACVANYKAVYEGASHLAFYRVLALHGIGTCERGKKDFLGSAKTFERASREPGHVDSLTSRFEEARSYHLAGDAKALELYQTLLKEPKLSPELKEKVEEEMLWARLKKGS